MYPEGEEAPTADPLAATARDAARGDVAAIRRLIDHVAPSVLRVARSVLGAGHPDLEDVVQETLVALVAGLPAFRGECGTRHYACRIAVRISLAARRRAQDRRRRIEELVSQGAGDAAEQDSPADVALAARRRQCLRMLLEELPEPQAETLVLRVVSGLSMQEVADATGVPLNTVRSRLRLAKEALARRLEDDPDLREELEVADEPSRPAS